jgi:hypothetical protein
MLFSSGAILDRLSSVTLLEHLGTRVAQVDWSASQPSPRHSPIGELPMVHHNGTSPTAKVGAITLILLGGTIVGLAILADYLNIGGEGVGFGWKQLIALIAGLVMLLVGAAWLIRPAADIDKRRT